MDLGDFGKRPVNIDQVGNFLKKDFHKHMAGELKRVKEAPLLPQEMSDRGQKNYCEIAIGFLGDTGKDKIYKSVLACRLSGVSYEQMAKKCKTSVAAIKAIEKNAIKRVMDKIGTQKILPVAKVERKILTPTSM